MTTGVTQAVRLGAESVACASTGNTSASMAAYAARAGMKAVIFIPSGQIALGKLSQALDYGATVVQIDGDFDDAMRLVRDITTFRRAGAAWRRTHEVHHVRVPSREELVRALDRAGFAVRSSRRYGAFALAPHRLAFFARKR